MPLITRMHTDRDEIPFLTGFTGSTGYDFIRKSYSSSSMIIDFLSNPDALRYAFLTAYIMKKHRVRRVRLKQPVHDADKCP